MDELEADIPPLMLALGTLLLALGTLIGLVRRGANRR